MIEENIIRQVLQTVLHPKLKKSLIDIGMIRNISTQGDVVTLTLALKNDRSPLRKVFIDEIEKAVTAVPGVSAVTVQVATLSQEEAEKLFPKAPLRGIAKVKQFLAIASGKGGVGKTTIAVNVALALVKQGYSVGLLDADVYGPSVPVMLALSNAMEQQGNMIVPREKYGLRIMSLGMTAGQNDAFIWRGPLVSKMIHQLLDQVNWGELDYLVIDLPPGTGDPSITIAQALPHCAILMVTTPQEVALADVRRSISLFNKTGHPIVGLVENMSYFLCAHSTQPIDIFGRGGGEKLSKESDIPLLGAIPLDLEVRQGGDSGVPLMVSAPDSATGAIFLTIARQVADRLPSCQ
ncbi:Mrp/NBP35 family ATP-binding protein [Desulfopila sp. IMCC35006]|uniref:Mrp/NBP35 family ATP-binding protein n=1 Tax=Desulfopila sp. IMCC35006 TaxID=2569542 RepID=UPI0010ACD831|nr:Mrp/NBP35 family ATP-binding protein [Desulfopila sp. IMCC35006]TKB27421.1 Mrp/NBP35 family ATP-binding protein [Desulfopila sp. IMCC35006]